MIIDFRNHSSESFDLSSNDISIFYDAKIKLNCVYPSGRYDIIERNVQYLVYFSEIGEKSLASIEHKFEGEA